MELIIISKRHNSASKLTVNSWWLAAVLALTLMITIAAFYAGAYYSLEISSNISALKYQQNKKEQLAELNGQKMLVEQARLEARENLDALATRLSKLQGHVMRLDALGSRLANMAGLEDINFDVEDPPGMGGPDSSRPDRSLQVADFIRQLEQLATAIEDRTDKLSAMEGLIMNSDLQEKTLPEGTPMQTGWVSSLFGWRADPISGRKVFHDGMDFAAKPNSLVTAVAAGIVTWSDRHSGYGNMVEINHGNGYVTRYAHNKQNLVKVGDKIDKGQVIAIIGSSGRSTGTHVHLEVVYNGKNVDPRKFISVN